MPLLKPFQIEDAQFLAARTRALAASEPGVGKSAQLITAANMVDAKRVGIVCPEIGMEHWRRECAKWGLRGEAEIIGWGDAHKRRDMLACTPDHLEWDVLVLDEVHFGKNPHARRTKAVFGKGGLGYYARHIWAASGTPAPNNAGELWPILRAYGKTAMDQDTFTRHFCYVDDQGKVRGNRPDRIDELRAILKSFSLRRLKKDVLPELGAIDVQEWYVKPDARFAITETLAGGWAEKERALRERLAGKSDEDLLIYLAGDEEFATLRRYNALLKAPAVFDAVKFEHENGLLDKVVAFGHHKEALAVLHKEFLRAGIPSALIYGNTPQYERDGTIEEWKRTGVVLLASLTIASTALDLTAAHQVIALEMDWVPGTNWQAWQRPHRQGQTNPVTVRVAMGTPIDEIVNDVLIRKIRDIAEIFD